MTLVAALPGVLTTPRTVAFVDDPQAHALVRQVCQDMTAFGKATTDAVQANKAGLQATNPRSERKQADINLVVALRAGFGRMVDRLSALEAEQTNPGYRAFLSLLVGGLRKKQPDLDQAVSAAQELPVSSAVSYNQAKDALAKRIRNIPTGFLPDPTAVHGISNTEGIALTTAIDSEAACTGLH
jgi:hypothetical protein